MNDGGEPTLCSAPPRPSDSASLGTLWSVVIAGEAIFVLPFLLPRLFRPTMLEVWGVSNFQFGMAFSVYGIVAMAAVITWWTARLSASMGRENLASSSPSA